MNNLIKEEESKMFDYLKKSKDYEKMYVELIDKTKDFDDEGYTEYYCHLGHPISLGSFCKDYE